jgi:dipeptidyl aminopeptidase/acylaminoacyl peptidase
MTGGRRPYTLSHEVFTMCKSWTVGFGLILSWAVAAPSLTARSPAQPAPGGTAPTLDGILSLERVGSPEISPDGRRVAYSVRRANWDENEYETQIWLADTTEGALRRLTTARKSALSPAWSPDGTRLAFISDRTDKRQIYLIRLSGGEAEALTTGEEGVTNFAWSPDGATIAFTATEPKPPALKDREKQYGEFRIVGQEHRMSHLFLVDVTSRATRPLTSGPFTVGSFDWSPDGRSIAFDHRIDPTPGSSGTADISIVTIADGAVRHLVTQDGPDTHPVWSPDGSFIAFQSAMANTAYYYSNQVVARVPSSGGTPEALTAAFDEDPAIVAWKPRGIFFSASRHTWSYLYRLDPTTRSIARLAPADEWIGSSFSLSRDGSSVACLGAGAQSMAEVFAGPISDPRAMHKLTDMNRQTAGWPTTSLDVISWKSRDGTTVEGVLHKPAAFDSTRQYPLLVVIHGGPTGVSRPIPYSSSIYPIDIWVPRGVLVLEPNYRGSAGYGEKFRALNVRKLGVGDSWDVLSGVDALVSKGMVDPARVGVMGWSQGGYISAFLATHDSARFKAISVGAGISDWLTYYVNTDIHPFTRQYLKATPWDDPEIYATTSPITYVRQARTPTLIQHGEADQRVPPPNAFELYQALQDQGVPVKLIVYKGFGGIGHGPTKPKSHRATMEHNLEWFDEHLFHPAARSTAEREPGRH